MSTTLELVWAIRRLTVRPDGVKLGAAQKSVLYALAAHQEKRAGVLVIAPSAEQVARAAGVSRSTALRVLDALVSSGLISRGRRSLRQPFAYDLSEVLRRARAEQSHGATSEKSAGATSDESRPETSEWSRPETSHRETSHAETSHRDSRVVSPCNASGLTVRPSDDLSLMTSPEGETRAREIPTSSGDRSPGHAVTSPRSSRDPGRAESAGSAATKSSARPEPALDDFRVPRSEAALHRHEWIEAYTRGIDRVRRGFTFDPRAFSALERVVSSRLPAEFRPRIPAWIEREAERFARAVEPKFYGGCSADGFERWCNAGCPTDRDGSRRAAEEKPPPYHRPPKEGPASLGPMSPRVAAFAARRGAGRPASAGANEPGEATEVARVREADR